MSRFNEYARRLDTLAKESFAKYTQAKEEYEGACDKLAQYPQHYGNVDHEYESKRLRAIADHSEAKTAFDVVQREYADTVREVEKIRAELVNAIEADYIVDPEQLDNNTLELMKSGVLKPADYVQFMNEALKNENHTMVRMVAKYAEEASKQLMESGLDHKTVYEGRERLNNVVNAAKTDDGREYLQAFDYIAEAYNRTVKNPGMISYWEQLTAHAVEDF